MFVPLLPLKTTKFQIQYAFIYSMAFGLIWTAHQCVLYVLEIQPIRRQSFDHVNK